MDVKERILTIRLMEKAERNPAYMQSLGISFLRTHPGQPERVCIGDLRQGQKQV